MCLILADIFQTYTGLHPDYVTHSVDVDVKHELIYLPLCHCLFTLFSAFSMELKKLKQNKKASANAKKKKKEKKKERKKET